LDEQYTRRMTANNRLEETQQRENRQRLQIELVPEIANRSECSPRGQKTISRAKFETGHKNERQRERLTL
jgi:hypothetical protein